MTINNKQIEFGLDTFGDLAFDDRPINESVTANH